MDILHAAAVSSSLPPSARILMIRGWRVGTRRKGGVSLINVGVRGGGTTSSASSASSAWVMTQGAGREGLPEAQGPQARHDSSL